MSLDSSYGKAPKSPTGHHRTGCPSESGTVDYSWGGRTAVQPEIPHHPIRKAAAGLTQDVRPDLDVLFQADQYGRRYGPCANRIDNGDDPKWTDEKYGP